MFFEEMMNSYWKKKAGKKKGFTLVEMMVVVAIIAVLTSIVVPVVGTHVTKARAATNAANLRAAKGAFTTVKLMNPEDYSSWRGGVNALRGISATEDEVFPVGTTGVTVPAPDAVEMTDGDIHIPEGTVMKAQIILNEDGNEEVYVTYNDLPIAYFAAVAENGSANPADYATKGANTAAGEAWVNDLIAWGTDIKKGTANKKVYNMDLYGTLFTQMTEILEKPEEQGDCLQCAMNKIDVAGAGGLLVSVAKDKLVGENGLLTNKGYNPDGTTYCAAYTPTYEGGGCSCDPTHGADAHVSTTSKLQVGQGSEACTKGGVHDLDHNHKCRKCLQSFHLKADGSPDHQDDTSIAYMNAVLSGSCRYCNYCMCCAQTGEHEETVIMEKPQGLQYAWPFEKISVPNGYKLATIEVATGVRGSVDAGICMSTDPIMGDQDGNGVADKGCGHSMEAHRE